MRGSAAGQTADGSLPRQIGRRRPDAVPRGLAAVVLAGGAQDPRLAPGLPNKTFLPLHGQAVVVRVVGALRRCRSIDRILVVGPGDLAQVLGESIEVIPADGSQLQNLAVAVKSLGNPDWILAVAADLPLITTEAVERFLHLCSGRARFYLPIVSRAAVESRFAQARKTYARVTSGEFCAGCLALFDPAIAEPFLTFARRVHAVRQKPWVLWARVLGPRMFLKLAFGRLSLSEAEGRLRQVTGVLGKAVVVDAPELALDIDDEGDLRFAERALAAEGRVLRS